MKIGIDLDNTLFGFPQIFVPFVKAWLAAGHSIYCTSNHRQSKWPEDCQKIEMLGLDPTTIDHSLMCDDADYIRGHGAKNKARMADQLDVVFDDHADHFQQLTSTPVFKVPIEKSLDHPRNLV